MSRLTMACLAGILSTSLGAAVVAPPVGADEPASTEGVRGTISGVVINGSQTGLPVADVEVVLRVDDGEGLTTIARTTADRAGWFQFHDLPADRRLVFVVGANHQGIHYPGPKLRLGSDHSTDLITIEVFDTVDAPNPLVVRRHEIRLQTETGVLRVTESMVVDNPLPRTYVGREVGAGGFSPTLQLTIPPNFAKVTFAKEYFGRQFQLVDGKLFTDVPWTPGRKELTFMYAIPVGTSQYIFERPMDVVCEQMSVQVTGDMAGTIDCNLPGTQKLADGTIEFHSQDALPAGFVLRASMGDVPVAAMTYAPWIALAVLVTLILVTTVWIVRSRGAVSRTSPPPAPEPAAPRPRRHPAARPRSRRRAASRGK